LECVPFEPRIVSVRGQSFLEGLRMYRMFAFDDGVGGAARAGARGTRPYVRVLIPRPSINSASVPVVLHRRTVLHSSALGISPWGGSVAFFLFGLTMYGLLKTTRVGSHFRATAPLVARQY